MAKIIAVANHKGGVGKTTTVVNVGAILASRGKKVLLVDLDSQANLTTSLTKQEHSVSVYEALRGKAPLPIVNVKENLDLVPSSLDLAGVELELASAMSREFILKDLLDPISASYDFILLDCAPSIGLLTVNAFTVATNLIIPLTAEALPSNGIGKILDFQAMVSKRLNPSLRLSGILITRWERSNLASMVEEVLREKYGAKVFRSKIRKNVALAEAPLLAHDILEHAHTSNGARDYKALTDELLASFEPTLFDI